MTSLILFQNIFILGRPRAANFVDVIKIATMFIKTTFKDSKHVQSGNHVLKCSLYLYFLI